MSINKPDIDLESAQRVVEAARKQAEALNCKMDIAVVDAGANLKAFRYANGVDRRIEPARWGPV
jgi:uncharacterized protein GlcG (DUF336 family)